MEWVEVAGKTVEEATEQALDQLGVAAGDAEVIVVDEPKTGLFGRVRVEARVRARVRPVGARPRRERSRRGGGSRSGQGGQGGQGGRQGGQRSSSSESSSSSGGQGRTRSGSATATEDGVAAAASNAAGTTTAGTGSGTSRSARRRRNRSKATSTGAVSVAGSTNGSGGPPAEKAPQRSTEAKETVDMAEGMTLEEQGEVGRAFVADLLSEFGMEGTVETRLLDEDTVEIAALGEDLGILVGPRGSTLAALQDLTRAVVQRQCPSRTDRILVDVAGYRERRSAALKRFSVQVAEEVLASGQEKALEPMSPADRKAVHDAINEMSGVETRSEGEDPNRHIVIAPAG
ncbi:MAG TPA: RNA-binding cell elongation regulator Jag/EloR [Acidimicrobiales bacterium]|nr:RNA-binding cell elongation regulator Jag/EloR [Acidimicrobiales bacterium]